MSSLDPHVVAMALLRLLSASIEFSAALLMIKFNRVESALRINAYLSMIGPTVLLLVTTVGLAGLAGKVPPERLVLILLGVFMILAGVHR